MPERESSIRQRVAEHLDAANRSLREGGTPSLIQKPTGDPFADISTALGAVGNALTAHTNALLALNEVAVILATEIDALRHQQPPS